MNEDLLVDFEDDEPVVVEKTVKYDDEYNEDTTVFYRTMREKKCDFVSHDIISCKPEHVFQYPYMWDPYTGEKKDTDPFGPLYFMPDELIYIFYKGRLKKLWIPPKDIVGGMDEGQYEGCYGEAVGCGEDLDIPTRGKFPESYNFRIPIDDCYLPPDSDKSIPSMGPKLTNEEIMEIEELAEKHHKNNYQNVFGKSRPSLVRMKQLYDLALSKTPDLTKVLEEDGVDNKEENLSSEEIREYRYKANIRAVNELMNM
jgi:hypothetical protein